MKETVSLPTFPSGREKNASSAAGGGESKDLFGGFCGGFAAAKPPRGFSPPAPRGRGQNHIAYTRDLRFEATSQSQQQ